MIIDGNSITWVVSLLVKKTIRICQSSFFLTDEFYSESKSSHESALGSDDQANPWPLIVYDKTDNENASSFEFMEQTHSTSFSFRDDFE